ncbi:MAG TPA: HAD-IA family hydrolase [Anaerolineales bacterium]|nr:HAD-IA family hydrolase [Anaerolineales bacterium]
MRIQGRVVSGRGAGAAFTQLDWARQQFLERLGIDPYPGTLNLILDAPADLARWTDLRIGPGRPVIPPDPQWCNARCYPVRLAGRLPGAIVLPDVPDYPEAQVEIIAALPLRERLSLADGDRLSLDISRPLSVRAVIFDVDGTLVDSLEAYHVVAEMAAVPHGILVTREAVRHALNTNRMFWDLILPPDQPDREGLIHRLKEEAVRQWPEVLRAHGRVFPGLRETLETLRARGAQLGIVTGSREGVFQPLRENGLLGFFGAVVTGKDVRRRKPDPEGLLKCVATLGVRPDEAVYVGDTPLDVQASRAAGLASAAVLTGAGDSALLSAEGPDWIVASHARLPDVLYIVHRDDS